MKNGKTETVLIIGGLFVTLAIILAVFISRPKIKTPTDLVSLTPSTVPVSEDQALSELEKSIEAGLYLEILSPADKSVVTASYVSVSGKTEANADIFINEKELKADFQGNFTSSIALEEGVNIIVVTASDADGNYSEKAITVTYELNQ